MNAATEMSPFNFTDSAANKVKALNRRGRQS
jgi:hypothetical protein